MRFRCCLNLLILPLLLSPLGSEGATPDWVHVVQSDASGMRLSIQFPPLQVTHIERGQMTYAGLEMPGGSVTGEPGKPRIPLWTSMLTVPAQGPLSASVVGLTSKHIQVPTVWPVTEQHLGGQALSDNTSPVLDEASYGSSAPYPAGVATISRLGVARGCPLARLEVHPVQYEPTAGRLILHSQVELIIDFGERDYRILSYPSVADSTLLASVLNPECLGVFCQPTGRGQAPKVGVLSEPTGPLWRIELNQDGFYRIDEAVVRQLGSDLDLGNVDSRTLRIIYRGKELPIWVVGEADSRFDPGDAIWFYGESNKTAAGSPETMYRDPYTDTNAYWLTWGGLRGSRLATEFAAPVESDPARYQQPEFYEFTVHAEVDGYWNRLTQVTDETDHWFWDPGVAGQEMRTYPVEMPALDPNAWVNPTVRLMLHGKTYAATTRRVAAYLDRAFIGETQWKGQMPYLLRSDDGSSRISARQLAGETHQLTIAHLGDQAGSPDAVLLNWLEVDYPRRFLAEHDYIEFTKPREGLPGLYRFSIDGFSSENILVFKKGISRLSGVAVERVEQDEGDITFYRASFQDEVGAGRTDYIAMTPSQAKVPLSIEPGASLPPEAATCGADYLIIVHQDLSDTVQRLADFRRSQGMRVVVVSTQAIYDAFNDGVLSPEAVRDFIRYAYRNWPLPPPSHVLLVGDGTWDYRSHASDNLVPVYQTWTLKWGQTSSDYMYACVDGDDLLPDLCVGRLPVSSNVELNVVIDKIIEYEQSPHMGPWRKDVLLVAGSGAVFTEQSETLARDCVPEAYDVSRVYVDRNSPYLGDTQDLIDEIGEGAVLVNFRGHGGGAIWSDAGLFRLEDVARLSNSSRLPFVASFTCFTAAFDEPNRRCLGEELLRAEKAGAVGFFSAIGLGRLYHDYYFCRLLLPRTLGKGSGTIGQILAETAVDFLSHYPNPEAEAMVKSYLLLGDPAFRVGVPRSGLDLQLHPGPITSAGAHIQATGSSPSPADGQAWIKAVGPDGSTLFEASAPVEGGRFTISFRIPEQIKPGRGHIKAYLTDGKQDFVGQVQFAVQELLFTDMQTTPSEPCLSDSVRIGVKIDGSQDIREVFCHWVETGDSLAVVSLAEGLFVTEEPWTPPPSQTPAQPSRQWAVRFSVLDALGKRYLSQEFTYTVRSGPFLAVTDLTFDGVETAQVTASIYNRGATPSDSLLVRFYAGSDTAGELLGQRESVVVPAQSQMKVSIPAQLELGTQVICVEVVGLGTYPRELWVDKFEVTQQGGTSGPVSGPDGTVQVSVAPDCVVADGVWRIAQPGQDPASDQADLTPVPLLDGTGVAIREVSPLSSRGTLGVGAHFTLRFRRELLLLPEDMAGTPLVIAHWQDAPQQWNSLETQCDSLWISAQPGCMGIFGVMANGDQAPPTIELAIDGQLALDGGFLPRKPVISVLIEDDNGVSSEATEVYIDGALAEAPTVQALTPAPKSHTLALNLFPTLEAGQHTIEIRASDAAGNRAEKIARFEVASEFDLLVYGNFPNPFSDETVLAYSLSAEAKSLSIKIYAVSGRLVRAFEHDQYDEYGHPLTSPEYHELIWPGTDSEDRELANGVYFCKFKAVSDDKKKTVEQIIKLAKKK